MKIKLLLRGQIDTRIHTHSKLTPRPGGLSPNLDIHKGRATIMTTVLKTACVRLGKVVQDHVRHIVHLCV